MLAQQCRSLSAALGAGPAQDQFLAMAQECEAELAARLRNVSSSPNRPEAR